ncbi:asparagine synthase (glutamine-hydrolyzing) [Blastochloris tepida]|uniref:asparagine synthase (glutamine-hydrolyzing) n=1 Tax=Blastochloris tepida TaxID=2233851 RepID=A0A348FVM6_9HYPH|nr:asparagine synthase (glutamine-hydrolyzing) [Blastochloris tepida]BBF91359.1 asparagine synthetase B [Blastochloris tepida]
MCGIAGLIDPRRRGDEPALARAVQAMADAIAHRGPDGAGVWVDAAAGLALSHRRLAIVDLSPAGAQPMVSADGNWAISYNGEIYNAAELRRHPALDGIAWRGHSDTEAIVESVARRGLAETLQDLNGMYAIALWDRRQRRLHLVRDRLGIKPLFFEASNGRLAFGSELKALRAIDEGPRQLNPGAVASFLRLGYVPAPHAIFVGVEKVLPGETVTCSADGTLTRSRYWRLEDAVAAGRADPLDVPDGEAEDRLAALLADAIGRQMIADVPLGAFLSGGVDSSTVAALMVGANKGAVRTFSIGFPEFGFDESVHAAAVARHLGTEHTELVVTAADALAVVPQLADMFDEPFADSSQIPTHLVSKLTRAHVTVALSGDGGDELFAGYNRHLVAARDWPRIARLPLPLRRIAAFGLGALPPQLVDGAARLLPRRLVPAQPADKIAKLAGILALDPDALYRRLVSQGPDPALHLAAPECVAGLGTPPDGLDLLDRMRFADTVTYLPDDILQKVDRASMAVALEARPPLLDHRIVEFAWRLPPRFLVRGGETKWILRRVLDRYVPRALIDRPKMGFGVPLADWLRGPLRDWAADLIESDAGVLDPAPARAMWREHLSGRRNHAYALWTLAMFEAWRRRWM